jgi:ferric-dicitrate binding protein FerR (iron transport regulator)
MTETNNIEISIVRYLQGDIAEDEIRAFETWLQESPANKDMFFRIKHVHDTLRSTPITSEEIEQSWSKMWDKIKSDRPETTRLQNDIDSHTTVSLEAGEEPYRLISKSLALKLLSFAAVGLVAIFIGYYIAKAPSPASVAVNPATYSVMSVPKGGLANTVTLPDGSTVILNAGSTLRYPSDFGNSNREAFLKGEAYFKVSKNDALPFIVRLDRQNIIVRGTSFSVEAYPDETQSVVTLLSGLVTIETLDNKGFKTTEKKLKPGQQAVYNNSTGAMGVSQTDLELATSRVQGVYRFKDEPLGNIVSRLEKYYNVKIGIADTSLRAIPFTGSFSRNQPIEDVLRIINHEKKFRLSRAATEGGYLINKK